MINLESTQNCKNKYNSIFRSASKLIRSQPLYRPRLWRADSTPHTRQAPSPRCLLTCSAPPLYSLRLRRCADSSWNCLCCPIDSYLQKLKHRKISLLLFPTFPRPAPFASPESLASRRLSSLTKSMLWHTLRLQARNRSRRLIYLWDLLGHLSSSNRCNRCRPSRELCRRRRQRLLWR